MLLYLKFSFFFRLYLTPPNLSTEPNANGMEKELDDSHTANTFCGIIVDTESVKESLYQYQKTKVKSDNLQEITLKGEIIIEHISQFKQTNCFNIYT